jgi:hypothetical protein
MSFNQSNSILSNVDVGRNSYSCRDQTTTWLWVYFRFTWNFSCLHYFIPCLTLFLIVKTCSLINYLITGRIPNPLTRTYPANMTLPRMRFYQLKTFFIYEAILIVFYILTALIFEFVNGNSIRRMSIARWIIEASFFPMVIFSSLLFYFFRPHSAVLLRIHPKHIYIAVFPGKAILFITMRYIEMNPLSTINDFQVEYYYRFCQISRDS